MLCLQARGSLTCCCTAVTPTPSCAGWRRGVLAPSWWPPSPAPPDPSPAGSPLCLHSTQQVKYGTEFAGLPTKVLSVQVLSFKVLSFKVLSLKSPVTQSPVTQSLVTLRPVAQSPVIKIPVTQSPVTQNRDCLICLPTISAIWLGESLTKYHGKYVANGTILRYLKYKFERVSVRLCVSWSKVIIILPPQSCRGPEFRRTGVDINRPIGGQDVSDCETRVERAADLPSQHPRQRSSSCVAETDASFIAVEKFSLLAREGKAVSWYWILIRFSTFSYV